MSSSSQKTLHKLAGEWKLNKSLSDDITPVLAIQGTNSLLRAAISSASVTLKITQPHENEYSIKQTATSASIPGTTEQYILDYEWRNNHDSFFGDIKGRSRYIDLTEAREKFPELMGDWDTEGDDGKLVLAEGGKPDETWTAARLWGFENLDGEKRFIQRVKVWNSKSEEVKVKMVYDLVK